MENDKLEDAVAGIVSLPDSWSLDRLGDGTVVLRTPSSAAGGKHVWMARIAGHDPLYRFRREFCKRTGGEFVLPAPGVYELRNISGDDGIVASGFMLLDGEGLRRIEEYEAEELIPNQKPVPAAKDQTHADLMKIFRRME